MYLPIYISNALYKIAYFVYHPKGAAGEYLLKVPIKLKSISNNNGYLMW